MQAPAPSGDLRQPAISTDKLRALIMPGLLVAVAALGAYRHHSVNQTPWQGASFGMFSSHDSRPSRTVTVELRSAEGSQRIRMPESLADEAEKLEVAPTNDGAADLASQILESSDIPQTGSIVVEVRRLSLDIDGGFVARLETMARGSAYA